MASTKYKCMNEKYGKKHVNGKYETCKGVYDMHNTYMYTMDKYKRFRRRKQQKGHSIYIIISREGVTCGKKLYRLC